MKKKVRVGAVQMQILSRNKNIKKIIDFTKQASKNKVDILCFPEIAFGLKRNPSLEEDLQIIKDLCKEEKIHIIINGYFKIENKIYNRSYIIDDNGEVLDYYDKIYLWRNELDVERGENVKVVDTKFGKIGMSTCWDMYFPHHVKRLKAMGAEIIFNSSYWDNKSKKDGPFVDFAPVTIANMYLVFYVFVNCLLKAGTSITQIASPYGKLSEIRKKEGLIFADLYPGRVNHLEKYYSPVFWDREEMTK